MHAFGVILRELFTDPAVSSELGTLFLPNLNWLCLRCCSPNPNMRLTHEEVIYFLSIMYKIWLLKNSISFNNLWYFKLFHTFLNSEFIHSLWLSWPIFLCIGLFSGEINKMLMKVQFIILYNSIFLSQPIFRIRKHNNWFLKLCFRFTLFLLNYGVKP